MKKVQQGRSMIEMLGVLAIIGVLSIGGLAGYTMAMNRHRANTVLDFAAKSGVIAQTQGDGSTKIDTTDCKNASLMGQEVSISQIDKIEAEREANGVTKVTVTFKSSDGTGGVSQALASRIGITTAKTSYVLNVDEGKWS